MPAELRQATYKGVPFGVTAAEKEAGRRTVVHEFPQRDDVYIEDLGKAPNRFTVNAFVLGQDWQAKRDALERVLDEPGPGTLVHPWYGELQVSQFAPYKTSHRAEDGLMAVISLSFCLAGQSKSPSASVNTPMNAFSRGMQAGSAACAALDGVLQIAGQSGFVVEQTLATITTAITTVQEALEGDVTAVTSLIGAATGVDLQNMVAAGQSIGHTLMDAIGQMGLEAARKTDGAAVHFENAPALPFPSGMQAAATLLAAPQTLPPVVTPENAGSMRTTIARNQQAVTAFVQQVATVEAVKAIVASEPESRAQAAQIRAAFISTVDAVLHDEAAPDAVYTTFTDMRAATLAALAEKARSAPQVVRVNETAVLSSLVVSYRKTADIQLETDLVRRNHVIHPGFVPPHDLEVLLYV